MNELEIIRSQLAVEQSHAADVTHACATAFAAAEPRPACEAALFREACVSYLVWVLARFEERDQTLSELLAARRPTASGAAAASAHQLAGLIGLPGTSREALSRLEAALAAGDTPAARAGWREFAGFFDAAWVPRRAALERALAEHLAVADWRTVCAIDADSILEERNRFARVTAELPAGIELRRAPPGDLRP